MTPKRLTSMRLSLGAILLSSLLAAGCLGSHSTQAPRSEPTSPASPMQDAHPGYGRLAVTLKVSGGETFPDSIASTGPRAITNTWLIVRRIGRRRVWHVMTDPAGHFTIPLPHGRYSIRFAQSHNAATWIVQVRDGMVTMRTLIEFVHTL